MTERTKSYSELLVNKDWKHRSFRDAAKEVTQTETLKAAWDIVPDERRRALFYLFRAAFLMGLSVEETLSRAFAETRSESSYTFDFGRNVDVDENLFDAYWMIWKLARSASASSTELTKYAWAFDSPELLLANSEFLSDAKAKWGDEVVDEFVSLASESGSDARRDMFAAFYRSRVKTPGLNVTVGFQANARFSGVLGCVEMYAQKNVSDTHLEYYYDMKARRVVVRSPVKDAFVSDIPLGGVNRENAPLAPFSRSRDLTEGLSKTLKCESALGSARSEEVATAGLETQQTSKSKLANMRPQQEAFDLKPSAIQVNREAAVCGPSPRRRGPTEGMSKTLKRESVWVEPPLENPVASTNFAIYPITPPKPEREDEKESQAAATTEPPVRGFLEWSQRADRLKRQAEEARRLAEGIKPYEPIVRRETPAEIALEVLRVAGLILVGIIVLPIAWILKVMFEPFFSEKEEKVYQKGEARLVDRVYLDKEHGVVAEIYMRRD